MARTLAYNDLVLFSSLLYSCVDVGLEWSSFEMCSKPIHKWLILSYVSVMAFRLVHVAGSRAAADAAVASGRTAGQTAVADGIGEFLLDVRHKGAMPRALAVFVWAVALPCFAAWTVLGTWWLRTVTVETPQCMPSETHFWFAALWLFLCYLWVAIHVALGLVAWALEGRVRRAERDLRQLEDDDVRSRWGQVSRISGYHALNNAAGPCAGEGLSPSEIQALPSPRPLLAEEAAAHACECSICLTELEPGDMVRRLPGCKHAFHRSCIDLWLLRRADCPLCKGLVVVAPKEAAADNAVHEERVWV